MEGVYFSNPYLASINYASVILAVIIYALVCAKFVKSLAVRPVPAK